MSAEHHDPEGGYKNSQDLLHSYSAKCATLITKTGLTARKASKTTLLDKIFKTSLK